MLRDLLVMLTYEIKRRPDLAQLAAQVDQLSAAQLRSADVAMPWMHEALVQLKLKHQVEGLAATADQWAVDGTIADPMGVMREWQGGETYLRVGRTELLITPGTLIWLDRQSLWIDTIQSHHIDPRLHSQSVLRGRMTRTEYYQAVRQRAGGKPISAPPPTPHPHEVRLFGAG